MNAPDLSIQAIDAQYKPFEPFESWRNTIVDRDKWEQLQADVVALADSDSVLLGRALEAAKRAAAVETGAIEGLYQLDRGVTITIATQAAVWDTALMDLEEARGLIQAQLAAYEHVLSFATQAVPIAEAWIRELHSVVCGAQTTYKVRTDIGVEDRPLPLGVYKSHPNHVMQGDGGYHAYAPVGETAPEMARLVAELQSDAFAGLHPVVQAAYAHHALVAIHPFADGNGRVARALASVFTYRAARVPLLILSDNKISYFDALEDADQGSFQSFVDFVFRAGSLALTLVKQSLSIAKLPSPIEAARLARSLNYTRGGFLHDEVDQAGNALLDEAHRQLLVIFGELGAVEGVVCKVSKAAGSARADPPPGYRRSPAVGDVFLSVSFRLGGRAAARNDQSVLFFVPVDCDESDEVVVICPEQGTQFGAAMSSLRPACTLAVQIGLRMWLDGFVSTALAALHKAGRSQLANAGYVQPGRG